ncbi:MAG: Flp pilus assembly protein CpaB [Alphaproteobacteria bacterium]
MRITAIIVIVIALGISGITFYLVRNYLEDQAVAQIPEVPEEVVPTVQVGIASRDLPAGTVLQPDDVKWQPWPDQGLDENFIVQRDGEGAEQIDEFVGTVVRRGITMSEPLTFDKVFRRDEAGFLAGALTPGMRGVAIRVNRTSGTGGFILPGDRVDVLLTMEVDARDSGVVTTRDTVQASETILRDIRVLAVDQSVDDIDTNAHLVKTVTVEVTPKQAETLSVAKAMGSLSLALRSLTPGDSDAPNASYTRDLDISALLNGAPAEKPTTGQAPAPPRRATVKVYRANQAETFQFSR